MKDLPAVSARMGLALPLIAFGARVLESNFGRPSCFGRYCYGRGSTGYNEILFTILVVGIVCATRTMFVGPSRWTRGKGMVGFLACFATFLAPAFTMVIPALQRLWP